jgi:hypothetical protein
VRENASEKFRGLVGPEVLQHLLSALNAADVQRISVPLDLVLKVLSAPKS